MVWDTATSGSFTEDEVNWRSTETRIDPKLWQLDAGEYTFVFFGREPDTHLSAVMLAKASSDDP